MTKASQATRDQLALSARSGSRGWQVTQVSGVSEDSRDRKAFKDLLVILGIRDSPECPVLRVASGLPDNLGSAELPVIPDLLDKLELLDHAATTDLRVLQVRSLHYRYYYHYQLTELLVGESPRSGALHHQSMHNIGAYSTV